MRDIKTEIINFWFSEINPAQWFQKNDDFDAEIRARFEPDYKLAAKGICDAWRDDPKGALALIIMLDQFPRNMYRDTPQAFATDHKALEVTKYAVSKQFDALLNTQEKTFLYLPLEHSENFDDQKHSVELFSAIKQDDPVVYNYAIRHFEVIEKFGRFPHRNAILGRESTDAEKEYLANPDSGF